MVELRKRPVLVLIASRGEWVGRSVESVLELNGYSVLRVEGGRRALDLARRTTPDALILDDSLSEMSGVDVCRALRDDPLFDQSTPIFIMSQAPVSNRTRLDAFEAGAWDFCTQPLDVETMLLKLSTYVRARGRLEDALAHTLIDPQTGVYSAYGLHQLAQQLEARALRNKEPFACLAVTAVGGQDSSPGMSTSSSLTYIADVCRSQSRKSDVVGYVGESRFAILAPDTDTIGARQFVDRLQRALARSSVNAGEPSAPAFHAGYYAVKDLSTAGVKVDEVVRRAEAALQHAQIGGRTSGSFSFDELPTG